MVVVQLLRGQVAVVTGGASGIGRGLVDRFAAEGMKVVIADIEKDVLDRAVDEVVAAGGQAIGVVTDVSDRASVERLATATIDTFGAVHLLCNNAGVETGGSFETIGLASWRWVIDVNFFGVVNGCQVFLPLLRQQAEAHIVNTASVAAFDTSMPTMAPYMASKHAVLGLTENLARELQAAASPVRVSLFAPGFVRSRITEAERNRPADVPSIVHDQARRSLIDQLSGLIQTQGMDPSEAAELVVQALGENRFFIFTHPEIPVDGMHNRLRWMSPVLRPTAFPLPHRRTPHRGSAPLLRRFIMHQTHSLLSGGIADARRSRRCSCSCGHRLASLLGRLANGSRLGRPGGSNLHLSLNYAGTCGDASGAWPARSFWVFTCPYADPHAGFSRFVMAVTTSTEPRRITRHYERGTHP